jgi:hypothetical protein
MISSDMTAIFAALAMVVAALIACASAALGGRVRDMQAPDIGSARGTTYRAWQERVL